MPELIITVVLVIVISAGCSLFEAVLYAVPIRHIEGMIQAGMSAGKTLKELRSNIERPIGAILTLNTIVNTAGAAIAGAAASSVFDHNYVVYFSCFFSIAILIFSEIIPKTAGVVYAKSLAPVLAFPMKALVSIMVPAIWFSSFIIHLIAPSQKKETVTAEEIRIMARLSVNTGGIMPYQKEFIENILTLQDKTVKDVMTPRTVIFSLSEHLTLKEASQKISKWEHSRFPVYDKDKEDIVGIVLTKELLLKLAKGNEDMRLTEIMRPVHFVVETAKLDKILMEFLQLRQHLFIVLDEYGGISGLITLEDIIEELLGREIIDESDMVVDKREMARKRRSQVMNSIMHKK